MKINKLPNSEIDRLFKLLGMNIRTLRENLRLNQSEFGDKFGLSRVSISNIEKGKQRPPLQFIFEIIKEYDLSYDDILPYYHDFQFSSNEEIHSTDNLTKTRSFIDKVRKGIISTKDV